MVGLEDEAWGFSEAGVSFIMVTEALGAFERSGILDWTEFH